MSGGDFVAKFLQAMDGRYDVNDDHELDLMLREMQRQGYLVSASRDEKARIRAQLRAASRRASKEAARHERPQATIADVPNSAYSVALEMQIDLLRWFDREGRRMFDPMDNPCMPGWADGERAASDCRRSLAHGDTYYFAAHLLNAIEAAAETMPDWTFGDHMLGQFGFFWFARPLRLPEWDGMDSPLAAISWDYDVLNGVPSRHFFFWCGVPGVERQGWNVVPTVCYTWASGELRSAVLGTRSQRFFTATDEYTTADMDTSDARDGAKLRLLSACIAFIDQRIFSVVTREASRATRRRHGDLKHEPLIRVIELRRKYQRIDAHGEHEARDWSCQWIVRGHWRQQWYPKLNRHQPKWITPYVKGPDNKPLKEPRATVFAVVR